MPARARMLKNLLNRQWLLSNARPQVTSVQLTTAQGEAVSFKLVRDDLLHPFLNGNKIRKLDSLVPQLLADGITDVVGIRPHLLVRGERPAIPTGNHLLARWFGNVHYVSRAVYADRNPMLLQHANHITGLDSTRKVFIIEEGASNPHSLLGLVRLVQQLMDNEATSTPVHIICDSGTGTTAIGLALGIALCQLPWKVTGVMLAGEQQYYQEQTAALLRAFFAEYGHIADVQVAEVTQQVLALLQWKPRASPRKFGKILPGELETCKMVARSQGVLLDPIYTLAAWEASVAASLQCSHVLMLHTGGILALEGLAQRFPDQF